MAVSRFTYHNDVGCFAKDPFQAIPKQPMVISQKDIDHHLHYLIDTCRRALVPEGPADLY
jgi:hypothetical protein